MAAPLRTAGTRQDTWIIRLHMDGVSLGVWDKKSGGELDSDEIIYYPGGMVPPITLGGKMTTSNVTLSRNYDRVDDHDKINALLAAVSKGKLTISQKPMDQDGLEYGRAITYNGILKRVGIPEVDSESTSACMIEIEATVMGYPVAG